MPVAASSRPARAKRAPPAVLEARAVSDAAHEAVKAAGKVAESAKTMADRYSAEDMSRPAELARATARAALLSERAAHEVAFHARRAAGEG
jgi:hypothetical protein